MSERRITQPGSGAAPRPRTVLLVEDDESVAHGIRYALEKAGSRIHSAKSVAETLRCVASVEPDILLLDVGLPDGSGFDLCRRIRRDRDIPVIFLTARGDEADIVRGLDAGGDDYIAKPFRIAELQARMDAVLRRCGGRETISVRHFGEIRVDFLHCMVSRNGSPVHLTATEYRVLAILCGNPGQVVTRDRLLEHIWDHEGRFVDSNTLSVNIRRIREKLEERPNRPRHLITVRGIGYKWLE